MLVSLPDYLFALIPYLTFFIHYMLVVIYRKMYHLFQVRICDLYQKVFLLSQHINSAYKNSISESYCQPKRQIWNYDDDELFLPNRWPTKDVYASFPAGTIVRESRHRKSPAWLIKKDHVWLIKEERKKIFFNRRFQAKHINLERKKGWFIPKSQDLGR